ncbi:hypothetical protein DMUE_3335 [Dictyocoela muelleri]|nr:hypothetical protein DMUE_3335 [Dictyocoela muelleri]
MNYSKMTIAKLKEECKKIGITENLKKKEMIAKLEEKLLLDLKNKNKYEDKDNDKNNNNNIKENKEYTSQNLFTIPNYKEMSENEKRELRRKKFGTHEKGDSNDVLLRRREKFKCRVLNKKEQKIVIF